ncbi:MAG: Gfo/Idh/MocA family oxidoreductase [Bacteroidota bacterium]
MSNTINWGIIGCGDVCEVKSGPAFNKAGNSKLVAVMRRDLAKAEDYAKRHGVPKFYNDAAELINDKEVNAIYIATPPSSHEQYTEEALKAGKPVYVEKPVTLNSASCERMIALSKKYNNKVSVAHYRRRLPIFNKIKSLLGENAIGNVRLVQLRVLHQPTRADGGAFEDQWRVNPELSGGGLFHDLSPHQLDIMYWLFGAPKQITGQSLNQGTTYNAPDLTTLQAVFDRDILLNGVWAFSVSPSSKGDICEIIGDKGTLRFGFFFSSNLEIITDKGTEVIEMNYPVNIQQPMIEAVTKYFRGEGENPCSLEEALIVMKMMDSTRS